MPTITLSLTDENTTKAETDAVFSAVAAAWAGDLEKAGKKLSSKPVKRLLERGTLKIDPR